MNSIPPDKDVLGEIPDSPGPLSDYNVRKEIWDDKKMSMMRQKKEDILDIHLEEAQQLMTQL